MARFTVEILLKSAGGPQAKAAMDAVGAGARGASPAIERLTGQMLGFELSIKGLGTLAAKAFGGFQLIQIGRQVLQEAKDAAAAQVLLQSAVRSTGGAAGYTADQLDEMASSFSRLTGVDDEVVAGAEAILLRYTRISGEAFPRAIQLALDMASAQGQQITSTSQLSGEVERLGKLLGDPVRAIQLFKREGKGLEEQQIRQIQNFMKQNDLAGAQEVVFAHLERQYAGTAAALRGEIGGAMQATSTAWGNLLEEFGAGFFVDTTGVNSLADALTDPKLLSSVRQLGEDLGTIVRQLAKLLSMSPEIDAFLAKLATAQTRWSQLIWKPNLGFDQRGNPIQPDGGGGGGWGGSASGTAPRPTAPQPAGNPQAMAAAARAAEQAQKQAQKLLDTYAAILAEHQETKRTQEALIALYARTGLSTATRLRLEEQINDEHEDRLLFLKTQKQFQDLGAARANEIAGILVRVNQEERARTRQLAAQKVHLEAQVQLMRDYRQAVEQTGKLFRELFLAGMDDLLQKLGALSREQAEWTMAGQSTDAVRRDNEQMYATLWSDWRDFWQDVNLEVRSGLMTNADRAAVEMERIREAYRIAHEEGIQGAMTAAEMEAALARVRSELLQQTLSEWGNFFSILEGLFGGSLGRIAGQIAGMFSKVNQAIEAGQRLAAALGSMKNAQGQPMMSGATASAIGSYAGGVLAMAAVLRAIYDVRKAQKEAERARMYHWGAAVQMGGTPSGIGPLGGRPGEWSPYTTNALGAQAREASHAIQRAVEEIAEAMGGVLKTFARLEIAVRADGKYFQAYVEGELLGTFQSFAEAQDAAILAAFRSARTTLSGLSELVTQGLEQFRAINTSGTSAAELTEWLASLREISELRWSAEARGVAETVRHLDELWNALLKLKEATPAVMQGFANLAAAEIDAWNSWRRNITGEKQSPKEQLEQLKREAELFNAQKAMRVADLKLRLAQAKIDYELLLRRGQLVLAGGHISQREIEGQRDFLVARAKLAQSQVDLYNAELEAMAAFIEALGKLIEEIEAIPNIDPGKLTLPRTGGTRGDARRTALDHLDDMRARALGEVAVATLEYTRALAAWREEAKEGKLSAVELAEGERLLRQERQASLRARAEELAGIGTDFTRSLAEGGQYFAGLRSAGRKETGIPNWLLDFLEGKFFEAKKAEFQQGVNQFFGFTNELAENAVQADILRQNLAALAATGKLSAAEIAEAGRQITEALDIKDALAVNTLLQRLLDPLKGLPEYAGKALELKRQEVDLQYRILQAQLQAYGIWEETRGLWEDSRDAALDAAAGLRGAAEDLVQMNPEWMARNFPGSEAAEAQARALEEATKILAGWRSSGEAPIVRDLRSFAEDLAKVQAAFGNTAEVMQAAGLKLASILDQYLKPIRDFREGRQLSNLSTLTGEGQFFEAQSQFRELVQGILGGDLSKLDQFVGMAQKYGELAQGYTAGSGLRFIMKELDDAALLLEQLVPGIAGAQAGLQLGVAGNPMNTNDPGTVTAINGTTAAINTGTDLMLTEMRSTVAELRTHTGQLTAINFRLSNPLSVRLVA